MNEKLSAWIEREEKVLLPTYKKLPIVLERGSGVYIYDASGKKYIDFYGGHAVCALGHSHPELVRAVSDQLATLTFYSNLCYLPIRALAAEALLRLLYPSIKSVFFVNSGAEANEAALKIARHHTGRERVVAMENSFHGRTVACLSVTGIPKYRTAFVPNLAGVTDFVPFGDMEALKKLKPENTAAVIVEPIQSMGGVVTAPAEYFQELRIWTRRHGIVLIFDEIQTGLGRTGRAFAGMHWEVEPDIVTMAKAAGGGIPAACCAVNEELASKIKPGDHGTTFGGGPVACAAVKAVCETIEKEKLIERASRIGSYLKERLSELPIVKEVRGMGLLLGFVTEKPAKEIQAFLLERGILVGTSVPPQVVRLMPPLTLEREHVDELVEALREV